MHYSLLKLLCLKNGSHAYMSIKKSYIYIYYGRFIFIINYLKWSIRMFLTLDWSL